MTEADVVNNVDCGPLRKADVFLGTDWENPRETPIRTESTCQYSSGHCQNFHITQTYVLYQSLNTALKCRSLFVVKFHTTVAMKIDFMQGWPRVRHQLCPFITTAIKCVAPVQYWNLQV